MCDSDFMSTVKEQDAVAEILRALGLEGAGRAQAKLAITAIEGMIADRPTWSVAAQRVRQCGDVELADGMQSRACFGGFTTQAQAEKFAAGLRVCVPLGVTAQAHVFPDYQGNGLQWHRAVQAKLTAQAKEEQAASRKMTYEWARNALDQWEQVAVPA